MKPPTKWTVIRNKKRYSVEKSTLLAGDDYWNGTSHERGGRNAFLYRTPRGRYFVVVLTLWQGSQDELIPLTVEEALELWDELPEQRVPFETAFPGVEVEDA